MRQLDDLSLVAQVVAFHSAKAFEQLVRKYQSPVRRLFLHLTCGDSELSDDLAQDTFIKAYTGIASFKNLSDFSTWLYRIAYNVFMIIFAPEKKRTISTRGRWTRNVRRSSRTWEDRWTSIVRCPR